MWQDVQSSDDLLWVEDVSDYYVCRQPDYEEAVVTAVENRLELAAPNSKDAESKEGRQEGSAALENGEREVASGPDLVAPASERKALAEGKLERGRGGLDKVPVVGKLVGRLVAMLRKAQ